MIAHKQQCDGQGVFLFLFYEKSYFRKKVMLYPGEEIKIKIFRELPGLSEPVLFLIERTGAFFLVDGKAVEEKGYCFLQNSRKESVLLVPVLIKNTLTHCRRVRFKTEMITVGSGFGQDIFYSYASLTRENAFRILKHRNGLFLESEAMQEGKGTVCIYLNGKPVGGKVMLDIGDSIVMMGLSVLVLKDMLLCTSFFGNLRIAENDCFLLQRRYHAGVESVEENEPCLQELVTDTEELHQEELEITLPKQRKEAHAQPLFLTIGPSATMVLPVILMATLGRVSGTNGYYQITVAMTAASAFLSVFWGLLNHWYRKHCFRKEEKERKRAYRDYLRNIEAYLERCHLENREILMQRYPHYSSFLSAKFSVVKVCRSWKEKTRGCDFIRLGTGDVPFQMAIKFQAKKAEPVQDNLIGEVNELCRKYSKIQKVPVGIVFGQDIRIGFAGKETAPILLQFLLQLAARYDDKELKMIYFYHKEYQEEAAIADCLKWLPHLWQAGRKSRFLAGDAKEAGELVPEVERLLHKQKEGIKSVHYLLIIANEMLLEGESLAGFLRENEGGIGATVCYVQKQWEQLPGDCNYFLLREYGEIRVRKEAVIQRQHVEWEGCSLKEAEKYMRSMAGACSEDSQRDINGQISFLDLYDCECIEELSCHARWRDNRTRERMRVPIGIGENGKKIYLDIHEKFHGPHGLVAGTTGAGKSELLQTYLLSLAVSFEPEEVSFFIIDYKGGGMGDILADLPHCSGVISNLSGNQIRRALLSIKSENVRRQSLLSQSKVGHIEEYQELYRQGEVSEPMPHLLLVVDEFAELKKEEPEFMQEIISLSQVGRSLGVHLILATQKPAGCVDDKIWSNTRFRLCLRVAEKQDSMDMLHRPDAAFLNGVGRGYLQVGNDELFVWFRAGYSKAPYFPGKKRKSETALVLPTGKRIFYKKESEEKKQRQLENIKKYLKTVAEDSGCESVKRLWMPELAERIILSEPEKGERVAICTGICDDPGQQRQYPLFYEPVRDGHLCLCAGPATGKSTFLQTFLWQLCMKKSPQEIQFLLAASDSAGVNCFERMPHCLGSMKESREAECFFYHLKCFFHQRKALLGGIGFAQYQKRQSETIPMLFLIIDHYGRFREMTEDAYEEWIEKLAGEGLNYGIYLVVTASGIGGSELPLKLFEKIKTAMTLTLSDRVLYGDVLRKYQFGILPKEDCAGRGLCKVGDEILEMQVPLFLAEDDYGRIEAIEKQSDVLCRKNKAVPVKFPHIPAKIDYEGLFLDFLKTNPPENRLPLGYVKESGLIESVDLQEKQPCVITGGYGSGKKSLMLSLLYGCKERGMHLAVFDKEGEVAKAMREVLLMKQEDYTIIGSAQEWEMTRQKVEKESEKIVFAVCQLADFVATFPYREEMPPMLVISRTEDEFSLHNNPWYQWLLSKQRGICLGGNVGSQRLLTFEDLGYECMNRSKPPGTGYYKKGVGKASKLLLLPQLSAGIHEEEEE